MISAAELIIWGEIKNKISFGSLDLSSKEINVFGKIAKYRQHDFIDLIYNLTSPYVKKNSNYTESDWDKLTQIVLQFNNKNAKHFYFQRISYNIFSEFSEKNISTFNAIKSMLKNDPGKQALNRVKSRIVTLTGSCKGSNLNKVFDMVNFFSPYLFKNMEDYIKYIFSISHRSTYGILAASRLVDEADQEIKTGAAFKFKNVVLKRAINHNNKKIVLFGLCQDWIFNSIKQNLNSQFVERLNAFLKKADFKDLDDNNFKLTKILIELNKATGTYDVDQFALDLQEFYLNKIYSRRTGQKVVNKKKMYGFLISIPGSSPRQALYQLSKMNKMKDIGFLIKKFPELSKLAMFV